MKDTYSVFIVFILLVPSAFAGSLKNRDYIGKTIEFGARVSINETINIDKLPTEFKYQGEGSVGSSNYSLLTLLKGKKYFLFFCKLEGKVRHILDIMPLPDLDKMDFFDPGSCKIDNKIDDEVFGVGSQVTEDYKSITKAWRANRSSSKFESISPKGFLCQAELLGSF